MKKRPPASPNKPPPAPAKMVLKGQPVPININLMVQGSTVQRVQSANAAGKKENSKWTNVGIAQVTKCRPHSAHVDQHVLKSMSRSPNVDSSFYNKFERLDRDTIVGDTAYKEKGVRQKSAGHIRHLPHRPTSSKPRTRSKSATCTSRKQKPQSESFLETAMSFDDETTQNTLSNAVRQISPRTLGIKIKGGHIGGNSQRKSRERSVSSKCSDGSDSQSGRSSGSGSWCSSRGRRPARVQRKQVVRKSRSRTRRATPKCLDYGCSSKKSSPDRKTSYARSVSSASRTSIGSDTVLHRFVIRNMKPTLAYSEPHEYIADFAYHYTPTVHRPEGSATKRNVTGTAAIDAVRKANGVREPEDIDRIMFHEERRPISSKLPKLKMMVAPTAMPLASLVRTTSAKMLMTNPFEPKRNF